MLSDLVLDEALHCLVRDASRLDICSARPATFAEVTRVSLGYKTVPQFSGPEPFDEVVDKKRQIGRMIVIDPITDGIVTARGEAKCWCITGLGRLLACYPVDTREKLVLLPGIAFTLPSIRIRLVSVN